jgi:prolyl oligopeptidase
MRRHPGKEEDMRRLNAMTSAGLLLSFTVLSACGAERPDTGAPATRKAPVTDAYHGVQVVDDYRWLEDWTNAEVRQWSESQNAYARSILDRFESRGPIADRVQELRTDSESFFMLASRKGKLFAMKRQPPKQQPFLIVIDSPDDLAAARTVVDPNLLDASGRTTIDFYEPSWDGDLIAVSLSKGGSESGDVHIYDSNGKATGEIVPRVQGGTAGGDVAWAADGKGFFYTRYPREGERPSADLFFYQQVYFHTLGGSPDADRYELGKELPRVAEIRLNAHPNRTLVTASVQHGDGGHIEQYLRAANGKWRRLTDGSDRILKVLFGSDDDLLLLTTLGAPRGKILRMPIADPRVKAAQTVIPEGDGVIASDFWEGDASPVVSGSRIFVPYQKGGPMEVKAFNLAGAPQPSPQALPVSAVSALAPFHDDLLFLNASYLEPPAWYRFSAKTAKTEKTRLTPKTAVSFDDAEVIAGTATSKDGTRVPYFVIRAKGTAGQTVPMIVSGYGGYGVSNAPVFNPINRMLIDQGIAVVQTVLRGGGEFGDEWHAQGRLARKQNVFDDFSAVLMHLIESRQTSSDRLAIMGGSNGGLLMGATFTQHPELARAVVSRVGKYDMLRVELSPNGEFNIPEFGTVKDAAQFHAMHAYSPYHHVRDATAYPAILFMTGANDPRVDPMQSRKMTARLQASGTRRPVLLRTSGNTGHGIGTPLDERILQDVDVYSFLFHELGVTFRSEDR